MEIEQAVNKRKKITRLLLILLIILLSLVCIKYLISKSNKYIRENGKSSMGAVIEQIQQTYDLQVSGYYSQLQLAEEFLLHERELSLETDTNKNFFEAWEKESESTLIFLQENGQAISAGGTKMRIDMPSKLDHPAFVVISCTLFRELGEVNLAVNLAGFHQLVVGAVSDRKSVV